MPLCAIRRARRSSSRTTRTMSATSCPRCLHLVNVVLGVCRRNPSRPTWTWTTKTRTRTTMKKKKLLRASSTLIRARIEPECHGRRSGASSLLSSFFYLPRFPSRLSTSFFPPIRGTSFRRLINLSLLAFFDVRFSLFPSFQSLFYYVHNQSFSFVTCSRSTSDSSLQTRDSKLRGMQIAIRIDF